MEQREKNSTQKADAFLATCFTAVRSPSKMFTGKFLLVQEKILLVQGKILSSFRNTNEFLSKSLLGSSGKFADLYSPPKNLLKKIQETSMAIQETRNQLGMKSFKELSVPSLETSCG